jgi:hypothetical protein
MTWRFGDWDCSLAIESNIWLSVLRVFAFGRSNFPPKLQEVPHFSMGALWYFAVLSAIWLLESCNLVSARVYQAGF